MKVLFIQLWEIILPDYSVQSDGCSLHISETSRNNFISNYTGIKGERPLGISEQVSVSEDIYDIVSYKESVRLSEVEFNNLIGLKNIQSLSDV